MHSQWVSIASVQKVDRNSYIHWAMNGKERNGERWEESDKHKVNWIIVWYIWKRVQRNSFQRIYYKCSSELPFPWSVVQEKPCTCIKFSSFGRLFSQKHPCFGFCHSELCMSLFLENCGGNKVIWILKCFVTFGIHPHLVDRNWSHFWNELIQLVSSSSCVAIGDVGIDLTSKCSIHSICHNETCSQRIRHQQIHFFRSGFYFPKMSKNL